jgi:hypothetical protein
MEPGAMPIIRLLSCLLTAALIAACAAGPQGSAPVFEHAVASGPVPWTHDRFDSDPEKFTFAVFSDLTGGERAGIFDVAIEQLRLLRPELIVNVGDLVEGGDFPREHLVREWQEFDARAGRALAPVFHTGGNHDLSSALQREIWEQRYGRTYYHFVYRNTLFLVLNTEDNPPEMQQYLARIRSEAEVVFRQGGWDAWRETEYGRSEERRTGRIGPGQAAYFRDVIARHPGVRHTFVLMHKPAWERPAEEHFATIEAALADRPYTVFHGHVHSYSYQQRHGRDYIRLATTGGVQNLHAAQAFDHLTLVTVSDQGVDIANLRLDGILDKTGHIPAGGEALCFEAARCALP